MRSLVASCLAMLLVPLAAFAGDEDWPQYRGAHRNGKVAGFTAPSAWPKELTEKWRVTVGTGVATPALVGDKLYVFAREEGNEVIRCLEAATGKEVWKDQYSSEGATGGASGFSGPRSSPAVAEGKVVTLGVRGKLSCLDASSGKVLWRKDDSRGSVPMFFVSSSPIIVDGKCIVHIGGRTDGAILAYDLASGEQKWKWTGDSPSYGSPVLMELEGTKVIVVPTNGRMVALDAADGKALWNVTYSQGRYNAATPIVEEKMLIYAGPNRGTTAETLEKTAEKITAKPRWRNEDNSLQFNSPVLHDGLLFGISNMNNVFCVDAETGKTLWTVSPSGEPVETPRSSGNSGAGGGFGRRGGGGGGGGYGALVDAGTVLFALPPTGELTVFEPSKEYKELARYKIADGNTYAHPIPSKYGIFIKDRTTLTLYSAQ